MLSEALGLLWEAGGKPTRDEDDDLLGVLVRMMLAQATSKANATQAFGRLLDRFEGDWGRVCGAPVAEVCRKMGVSDATLYNWRKKYGGLGPSELKRLKMLEAENERLKRMVADLSLDKSMLQDVLSKKL